MNAKQAIENLEKMSAALDKAANDPKNYNSPYAQLLENMSWEMHKHAKELEELNYLYQVAL